MNNEILLVNSLLGTYLRHPRYDGRMGHDARNGNGNDARNGNVAWNVRMWNGMLWNGRNGHGHGRLVNGRQPCSQKVNPLTPENFNQYVFDIFDIV